MGAATRASTAAGVDALLAVKRPAPEFGDELLAAARIVASSHQLVTTLADPGIPGEQRSALASRVLASLGLQARQVVGVLAAGRWSEPADLVGAIESLGFRALATAKGSDDLESQLFAVRRTIGSDGRLELALGAAAAPIEARLALVDSLLKDAQPATRSIVRHVVQLPRGRKPVEAIEYAQSVVADARDRLVAVVQTAQRLTPAQATALATRLESGYGRKIAVNQVVDPTLVGGIRITIGDDVIDGTVRARLDDLRLRLAG
ncbi:F0F1 ATP synthase subunit delta [uncultured Amnibacterium sp.]|uniref:F0F1 ATP synthase subunit delta n=1 Tax=uncultured Amnibacterium sp. TaxID=1631851 RepID=UPI0035CA5546